MWLSYTYIYIYKGFPSGSVGKESTCSAGDQDSTLGREDPLDKAMATTPA